MLDGGARTAVAGAGMSEGPLLTVSDLKVEFPGRHGVARAVDGAAPGGRTYELGGPSAVTVQDVSLVPGANVAVGGTLATTAGRSAG